MEDEFLQRMDAILTRLDRVRDGESQEEWLDLLTSVVSALRNERALTVGEPCDPDYT